MEKKQMAHKMPADFQKAIDSHPKVKDVWADITSLARNEWICWVTSGKKAETRNIRYLTIKANFK